MSDALLVMSDLDNTHSVSGIIKYIINIGPDYWTPRQIFIGNVSMIFPHGMLDLYLQKVSACNTMQDTNKYHFGIDGTQLDDDKVIELVHHIFNSHNCQLGSTTVLYNVPLEYHLSALKFIDMYFDPVPEVKSVVEDLVEYFKASIKEIMDNKYNAYRILYFGNTFLCPSIHNQSGPITWLINNSDADNEFITSNLSPSKYSEDCRIRIPWKLSDSDDRFSPLYSETNYSLLQRYVRIARPFKGHTEEELMYVSRCYDDPKFINVLRDGYLQQEIDIEDLVNFYHDYPAGYHGSNSLWNNYSCIPSKKIKYTEDAFYEKLHKILCHKNTPLCVGLFNYPYIE